MQISLLEEFVVWADNKTFEAAAKQLHISQSTLSKHLIALENELGASLINRQDKARLQAAILPVQPHFAGEFLLRGAFQVRIPGHGWPEKRRAHKLSRRYGRPLFR